MNLSETRGRAVQHSIERIRAILDGQELTRDRLADVLGHVRALADERGFWSPEEFPGPDEQSRQARYLIQEDPNQTFSLYLNVMLPGRRIPPHNHTTWACVAGVEGEEHNFLYRRLDDGSQPGHAELELADLVVVGPQSGVALLPDDIHSVEIRGEKPIRHLHMYGRALETLNERLTFDLEANTCKIMPIGVQTRR